MTNTIRDYSGRYPRVDDALMRAAYLQGVITAARFYGPGTADWDQKAVQVALNEHTADYLYAGYTPLTCTYVPGSRPLLERVVARVVRPEMSDRDKVFAIVKYCHGPFLKDYPHILPPKTICLNAVEEALLQLSGGQCEDRTRLIICLCQIAGIPARVIASYSYYDPDDGFRTCGGHAIPEIYVDGGWALFDSLRDFYFVRDDGRLASTWDLLCDPTLARRQSAEVMADCGADAAEFAEFGRKHLNRRKVVTLANYSVMDFRRYEWKWIWYDYSGTTEWYRATAAFRAETRRRLLREAGVPDHLIARDAFDREALVTET